MVAHELRGCASQPSTRPLPLFKILKGKLAGERIAEFPAFWACAQHANCRNQVRIAKNCPRIATRIAKLALELSPELPGCACELSAELCCCLYVRMATWHAAIEVRPELPRAHAICHPNCQTGSRVATRIARPRMRIFSRAGSLSV